jgi:hypothetical protein
MGGTFVRSVVFLLAATATLQSACITFNGKELPRAEPERSSTEAVVVAVSSTTSAFPGSSTAFLLTV